MTHASIASFASIAARSLAPPWVRGWMPLGCRLAIALTSLVPAARADHLVDEHPIRNDEYYYEYYATRCAKGTARAAAIACEKALALRPEDVASWTNLGVQLGNLGDYTAALRAYNRALTLDPDYSLALVNRCANRIALNRLAAAIDDCTDALDGDGRWGELGPEFAWYNLGVAQERLERYADALASYQRAVEIDGENAAAWNGLGYAYERAGQYDAALDAYSRATNLAPEVTAYRANYETVQQRIRF